MNWTYIVTWLLISTTTYHPTDEFGMYAGHTFISYDTVEMSKEFQDRCAAFEFYGRAQMAEPTWQQHIGCFGIDSVASARIIFGRSSIYDFGAHVPASTVYIENTSNVLWTLNGDTLQGIPAYRVKPEDTPKTINQ